MCSKKCTRFFFEIAFLFVLGISFPLPSHADGTALTITPSLVQIQAKPPADIWTPFTITNNSNQEINLQIGYKTFDPQASSNGHVVFLNDTQSIPGSDQKIFEKMQVVDDQNITHDSIIIGPKQTLRSRLRITLPAKEPASDYYFSIILLQKSAQTDQNIPKDNNSNQKTYSQLLTGIGLNVLLAVGDKETPMASIETFSTPLFVNGNDIQFSLSVHNEGTHFINASGIIEIKDMFGQTIGKVPVPSSLILSGTSRKFTNETVFQDTNENNNLIWHNNFLFGFYTATLSLNTSNNGPVYNRRIHFIAFPFVFFLELLLVLGVLGYTYLRVKKKLS